MSFPSIKNNVKAHTLYPKEGGEEKENEDHIAPLDKIACQPKKSGNLLEEIGMKRFIKLAPNYSKRIQLPFNNDIEFGFGINPKGRIFSRAITYEETRETDNYARVDQKIFSVVTKQENEKQTRVVAGMGVSGTCFEVSGELEYMTKAITNEKTSHLYILHSYESNKKLVIKKPKLLNGAKSYLQKKGLSAFIKAYGTHYVSGFINAASFFGEIKIQTSSTENARAISIKAKAVISKLGSLKAEYSNDEKSLDDKYNMEVRTSIRGLPINAQIATISQLWGTYGKFIACLNKEIPPNPPT